MFTKEILLKERLAEWVGARKEQTAAGCPPTLKVD